jgi:hypothetical protein
VLQPAADCFEDVGVEEREFFCGTLEDYVRLYAFLSQVIEFVDVDLEKLYLFGRLLLRRLKGERTHWPIEILGQVRSRSTCPRWRTYWCFRLLNGRFGINISIIRQRARQPARQGAPDV